MRRIWILLAGVTLAVGLVVLATTVTLPYVALGPGPTFNTLGVVDGEKVVRIEGEKTYPAPGHLNLTTVSVVNGVTVLGALRYLVSGERALVPREQIFEGLSEKELKKLNSRLFKRSENAATLAALGYLGYPTAVIVEKVQEEAAAQGELSPGDEILAANDEPVSTAEELVTLLEDSRPGDRVELRVQSGDGPARSVEVVLGSGPEPHGYLGILVTTNPAIDFEVMITLTEVGGPSAGLMFSLGIVDKLTPMPLSGGRFIAGTGTITPSGQVGPIGGIRFKMTRAAEAGAKFFLVPKKNCNEAVQADAADELRLIKVDTLADAVSDLQSLRGERPPAGCR